jgi:hypothetical protein
VLDRRAPQTCQLERIAGYGIIAHGEAIVPIFMLRQPSGTVRALPRKAKAAAAEPRLLRRASSARRAH